MKAELVPNIDEVGMSGWEDHKETKVIVARLMEGQTIHHRESRSVRDISIITCITAGGESLTPYTVTSQDSDAICKRLIRHAICLGVDFVLRWRSKPYVSRKLFLEYINTIFVTCLKRLQESEEFEACEVTFLKANCSPHMTDDVVAVLTSVQV
jgi:hypothetical protein